MKRFPAYAFAALVVASIGAFFITQHLKTSSAFIAPVAHGPGAIDPIADPTCKYKGKETSYGRTSFSFYLPDHSDTVVVSIVNTVLDQVRSLGSRKMLAGPRHVATFTWNGRDNRGRVVPEKTTYYMNILLKQEKRSFAVTEHPIHVLTHDVTPQVLSVRGPSATGDYTIRFTPRTYRYADLLIYSSSAAGKLTLAANPIQITGQPDGTATWDGKIDGDAAPAGKYVIGIQAADSACVVGRFPATNPPATGTIKRALITIR